MRIITRLSTTGGAHNWISERTGRRAYRSFRIRILVQAIFSMTPGDLQAFIQSPYNRVADVKMGLFFVDLGRTGIIVLGVLVLVSIFVQGAWCRYLCPYGALLGLFSWLSPARVTRMPHHCLSCGLCDRACAARLPVSKKERILSPECTGCLDCVAVCPVSNALEMALPGSRRVPTVAFAGAVLGFFLAGYVGARTAGSWANGIDDQEYVERLQDIDSPLYGHPGR